MYAYVNKEKEKGPIVLLAGRLRLFPNRAIRIDDYVKELHQDNDYNIMVEKGWIIETDKDPFAETLVFASESNVSKEISSKPVSKHSAKKTTVKSQERKSNDNNVSRSKYEDNPS